MAPITSPSPPGKALTVERLQCAQRSLLALAGLALVQVYRQIDDGP